MRVNPTLPAEERLWINVDRRGPEEHGPDGYGTDGQPGPGRGAPSAPAPTPGQTVGPFFGYALPYDGDSDLVPPYDRRAVRLHGHVFDGAGDPVPDAIIEIWQADDAGRIPRAEGSLHRDGQRQLPPAIAISPALRQP